MKNRKELKEFIVNTLEQNEIVLSGDSVDSSPMYWRIDVSGDVGCPDIELIYISCTERAAIDMREANKISENELRDLIKKRILDKAVSIRDFFNTQIEKLKESD